MADSSYSDLEANLQKERILKILDDTIKKIEFALCIPTFLKNDAEILRQWLEKDQVVYVQETCQKYRNYQSGTSAQSKAVSAAHVSLRSAKSETIRTCELSEGESHIVEYYEIDADLSKVVHLLYDNQDLRNNLTEIKLSAGAMEFINMLKNIQTCIADRLNLSPLQEMKRETELSQLYKRNERDKEEVMKLKTKLALLLVESEETIEQKKIEIKREQEKIEKVQEECRENIRKQREEAEKQINWDMKDSEFRLEELQNALKISQHQKESQLKDHLASEKDLRTKRFKVESQLVAMLQKYDTDIGDRQAQLEEMTAAYEEEKEQMIKLQECFDQQEIEYLSLMEEKELYERQVWEAKLYEIQCKIAARKIQRFYRAYLTICKAKGKKGKGKGKGKKKK